MAPKGSRPSFIGFGCRGAKAPENVSVGPPQPLPTVQRGQRLPLARVGHSQSSRPGLHSTNSRVASLASTGPDQDERASGSGQHGQHYSEENTVKHVTGAKRNADTTLDDDQESYQSKRNRTLYHDYDRSHRGPSPLARQYGPAADFDEEAETYDDGSMAIEDIEREIEAKEAEMMSKKPPQELLKINAQHRVEEKKMESAMRRLQGNLELEKNKVVERDQKIATLELEKAQLEEKKQKMDDKVAELLQYRWRAHLWDRYWKLQKQDAGGKTSSVDDEGSMERDHGTEGDGVTGNVVHMVDDEAEESDSDLTSQRG